MLVHWMWARPSVVYFHAESDEFGHEMQKRRRSINRAKSPIHWFRRRIAGFTQCAAQCYLLLLSNRVLDQYNQNVFDGMETDSSALYTNLFASGNHLDENSGILEDVIEHKMFIFVFYWVESAESAYNKACIHRIDLRMLIRVCSNEAASRTCTRPEWEHRTNR